MKIVFLILITACCGLQTMAQTNLDSLFANWHNTDNPDSTRMESYANYIFFKYGNYDPDSTILLSNELYEFSRQRNSAFGMKKAYYNIGFAYYRKSQYAKALRYLRESEKLADKPHGGTLTMIGAIYAQVADTNKLVEYWEKALAVERSNNDKRAIAGALINMGLIYRELNKSDTARVLINEGIQLSKEIGAILFVAHGITNLAQMHLNEEEYDSAYTMFETGRLIYDSLEYKPGIALSYLGFGTIHSKMEEHKPAEVNCLKAYKYASESDDLETQFMACQCLYSTYKALSNGTKALEFHEQMISLKESFEIDETAKKLQQMEFQQQMIADSLEQAEKHRAVQAAHAEEVRKKDKNRNIALGSGFLLLLFAVGLYSRLRYVRKSKAIIEKEKDRSDNLLLNILPAEIAEELKAKGRADARDFDMVSILFTDFKGFTAASEKLSAQDLVTEINVCFEAFDAIIDKYDIEKIKTIGDSYMAAGGLPVPTDDSVKNTVLAALKMQEFISNRKIALDAQGKPGFEMRVGVHTGPVVAGIVGVKKFQYDIWGDTVNTASRMESSGEVGKVNISQTTYELLKDSPELSFENRGKIEAKGKGEVEMYFVSLR